MAGAEVKASAKSRLDKEELGAAVYHTHYCRVHPYPIVHNDVHRAYCRRSYRTATFTNMKPTKQWLSQRALMFSDTSLSTAVAEYRF
jgi:hypothetical protein